MGPRDPLAGRLPVTLLTGFLGSGKTTLLGRLLRHPAMAGAAVVINEVGEIGIDHDLVTTVSENISLLANGCVCCAVRTDLQETLRELFAKRHVGEVPDFDRVIVETTGLADPAPVVQTLASDTLLAARYRLDGLVTLVDAAHGLSSLERQSEAVRQVALADRIFITKPDLVSGDRLDALHAAIQALNPQAPRSLLLHGEVDPAELTGLGLASARASAHTLRFLGEPLDGQGLDGERRLGQRPSTHDPAVRAQSLRFETPFTWAAFSAALDLLATLRGPDLLRIKGIVNVQGQPVVVQGVQHIFHEPVHLDRWPSADTGTRLVFITRNIAASTIGNLMAAVAAASPGASN